MDVLMSRVQKMKITHFRQTNVEHCAWGKKNSGGQQETVNCLEPAGSSEQSIRMIKAVKDWM